MGVYTRKQEEHIRRTAGVCRGPLYPPAADLKLDALEAGDLELARRLNRDFRGTPPDRRTKAAKATLGAIDELLERGEYGQALMLWRKIARPCRRDISDLVIAAEVPGLPVQTECPGCGTQFSFTPPVFGSDTD